MSSIFKSVMTWIDVHQKGIRTVAVVVGAGATIATPILAAKATQSVTRKVHEAGATTKEEKIKIARKDPWVWATAGTTVASLGCGAITYGLSNRIISKTNEVLDKTVDKLDMTVNELDKKTDELDAVKGAISELPDKEQKKIEKASIEKKMTKALQKRDFSEPDPGRYNNGEIQFIDGFTGQTFYSTFNNVSARINEFNERINDGYKQTHAHWMLLNGMTPRDQDWEFIYDRNVKLMKDDDHFYAMDTSNGRPVGWIEFYEEPRHRRPDETIEII